MGGHAFKRLYCPRISCALYLLVRQRTLTALRQLFAHVAIPTEMPSKTDYGDIDFLVSDPLHASPTSPLDWTAMVSAIKAAFGTEHGKRGFLTPSVMYFAILAPGREDEFWVQVDVKVCDAAVAAVNDFEGSGRDRVREGFVWERWQLAYASGSKMLGSLMKPLGITISPEGLFVRVEEIEETNFPGSMVWVTKDPRDVLRIAGLNRRILHSGFKTNEEIYEYFASPWLFNPAHFAKRLQEEKYVDHLEERSAPWVYFVTQWIPQMYPGYRFIDNDIGLEEWYKNTRASLRDKVFTLFPKITPEYYAKRGAHLKEVEEHRLRELLMKIIPKGSEGWRDDLPQPPIMVQAPFPVTPPLKPTELNETPLSGSPFSPSDTIFETPPSSPPSSICSDTDPIYSSPTSKSPWSTPLYLSSLPRTPPFSCTPYPPPSTMSLEAKLLCIARWTRFNPDTGTPYLVREPREKKFEMCWADAGTSDEMLVRWVREMWWVIWMRQCHVNYVGMWRKRFEKEDAKAEKERTKRKQMEAEEAREMVTRKKILGRLKMINTHGVVGE